jgi:hypothetical protein
MFSSFFRRPKQSPNAPGTEVVKTIQPLNTVIPKKSAMQEYLEKTEIRRSIIDSQNSGSSIISTNQNLNPIENAEIHNLDVAIPPNSSIGNIPETPNTLESSDAAVAPLVPTSTSSPISENMDNSEVTKSYLNSVSGKHGTTTNSAHQKVSSGFSLDRISQGVKVDFEESLFIKPNEQSDPGEKLANHTTVTVDNFNIQPQTDGLVYSNAPHLIDKTEQAFTDDDSLTSRGPFSDNSFTHTQTTTGIETLTPSQSNALEFLPRETTASIEAEMQNENVSHGLPQNFSGFSSLSPIQAPSLTSTTTPPSSQLSPVTAKPILTNKKDVVTAYKIFLRRFPESPSVIEPRVGIPRERLLSSFIMSSEHLNKPEHVKLIFEVAKEIIAKAKTSQEQKQVHAPDQTQPSARVQ